MKLPSNHKQTTGSPQCERCGSYATRLRCKIEVSELLKGLRFGIYIQF